MAELTPRERLQPCLLDRLTDDDPKSSQETREMRVVSVSRYRQAVLRDLAWLLNTSAHTIGDGVGEFEDAEHSVLNYGIEPLSGRSVGDLEPDDMARRILRAIREFEPRVMKANLAVHPIVSEDHVNPIVVAFEISGQLWTQRASESLYIKTELDLETGHCAITRDSS